MVDVILLRVSEEYAGTPNSIPETCDTASVSVSILTKLLLGWTICNRCEGAVVPIPSLPFALSHFRFAFCKTLDVPLPINSCPVANVPTPEPPLSTANIEESRFADATLVVVIAYEVIFEVFV